MTPIGDDTSVIVDPYAGTAKMNGEKNGYTPKKADDSTNSKDGDTDSKNEKEKKEELVVGMFEVVSLSSPILCEFVSHVVFRTCSCCCLVLFNEKDVWRIKKDNDINVILLFVCVLFLYLIQCSKATKNYSCVCCSRIDTNNYRAANPTYFV